MRTIEKFKLIEHWDIKSWASRCWRGHQRPALAAEQQHFVAAGLAQAVGILPGPVDLDVLVAVLGIVRFVGAVLGSIWLILPIWVSSQRDRYDD